MKRKKQDPKQQLRESASKELPGYDPVDLMEILDAHEADEWEGPIDIEEYYRQLVSGERLC